MTTISDETKHIIIQLFLVDPTSETPKVHPKKIEKRQSAIIFELESIIENIEDAELDIDTEIYHDAIKVLRKIKGKEAYFNFVDELLAPYY